MKLAAHPAAALWPLMPKERLEELARDIAQNGQKFPIIVTRENLVLDGRNRLEACRIAGVEPRVEGWAEESDGASPTAYVMSVNAHRRHMTESQLGLIAAAALPMLRKEATARAKRGTPVPRGTGGRATEIAAEALGIGGRTVARAAAVLEKAPAELVEQIRDGKATLKQAEKSMRHAERVAQAKAFVAPVGEYPVIVADPPWPYEDTLDGSDRARGGTPYPTMTIGEICELKLPLAADAAVFLWVTNSHLIDPGAYAKVVEVWGHLYGLKPKQIRTWIKPRMGLGRAWRNDTEHLVLLTRGRPVFAPVTQTTSLHAPLGQHSEKPQQAFDDIVALCPAGPHLEMFARAERPGWVSSGSELQGRKKRKLLIVDRTEEATA